MAWEQLVEVMRAAQDDHETYVSQPPRACPNDGEPLQVSAKGVVYCRYDGYRPAGQNASREAIMAPVV